MGSKALSDFSADQSGFATSVLAHLASQTDHRHAISCREHHSRHRDRVPEALPPELARSRVFETAEAAAFCGFSVAHWRRLNRSGKIPKPVPLSTRKLGWRAGDLIDWL